MTNAHGYAVDSAIGRVQALAGSFARAFDILLDWQARARERRQLGQMDDHMLRDIGMSRADVERELRKPIWRL